jgi:hypothetical protein
MGKPEGRLAAAVRLRNAATAFLQRNGRSIRRGAVVFEQHAPEKPYPHLSLSLISRDGMGFMMDIWGWRGDWYGKVMNLQWRGDQVDLVSFRRGEWETELLAMARAAGVTVH